LQASRQKVPLRSWAVSLAALFLGLAVVCLTGAALAVLLNSDGAGDNRQAPLPSAAAAVGTPTSSAGMQASSEQMPVETYGGIPLPQGAGRQQVVGAEQDFSLIIQQPFDRVVAFYQKVMPEREWVLTGPDISPSAWSTAGWSTPSTGAPAGTAARSTPWR